MIGSPISSSPARRSVLPVDDDVGDHVGDTELDGGLDGSVQPDDLSVDARVREVLGQQPGVRRGDPSSSEVGDPTGRSGGGGEPEGGVAEVQRQQLLRRRTRVLQQVASRDADLDRSRSDVDGDVPRAQEEELGVVARVRQDQLPSVRPLPVARLVQHLGGRLCQQSFVGNGDP